MSASVPVPPERIEFGVFSLDLRSGELRKRGVLPEQSFQVLAILLEHPGELVNREQLRLRLWPDGTFVDFDHSINSTIKRLRGTLGDSAATPRFYRNGWTAGLSVHISGNIPSIRGCDRRCFLRSRYAAECRFYLADRIPALGCRLHAVRSHGLTSNGKRTDFAGHQCTSGFRHCSRDNLSDL
jgi:hypothetical protein